MVVVVSGVGPHSIGETLVNLLVRSEVYKVVALDVISSTHLKDHPNLKTIQFDLNPLDGQVSRISFADRLRKALRDALGEVGDRRIGCLVQTAGIYWSGRFIDSTEEMRNKVFGLNLLGHVELLHAAMSVNLEQGVTNCAFLSHIDVGSFQGLLVREERSIYAMSKSAGVDIAASLYKGREVLRAIYFAPGPIDTFMLHDNHWTVKALGDARFILDLRRGDSKRYREIFVEGSESAFSAAMAHAADLGVTVTMEQFHKYLENRRAAFASEFGVLTPEECAHFLYDLIGNHTDNPSGVYLVTKPPNKGVTTDYCRLEALNRYTLVKGT